MKKLNKIKQFKYLDEEERKIIESSNSDIWVPLKGKELKRMNAKLRAAAIKALNSTPKITYRKEPKWKF